MNVGRGREQQAALLRAATADQQLVRTGPGADVAEHVLGQPLKREYPAGAGNSSPQLREIGLHRRLRSQPNSLAEVCPTEVVSATIRPATEGITACRAGSTSSTGARTCGQT